MRKPIPLKDRFWTKVDKSGDCWCWTGAKTPKGYGSIRGDNDKNVYAHRASYEMSNGPIPEGRFVCHTCDNRSCVNPAHLFIGTAADNSADMVSKGRQRNSPKSGEAHGMHKLTAMDVVEIRRMYAAKEATHIEIAKRFGVTKGAIGFITRGETWTHL